MAHQHIDIAFCVNDGYVQYVTVAIISICLSNRECDIAIHILSDDIKQSTKERLERETARYQNLRLHFYDVDDTPLNGLEAWSKYTWYRLLIQDNLPKSVHKVLYLDADTLVTGSLKSLFEMSMEGYAIAGVLDPMTFEDQTYMRCLYPKDKEYVCAGVLMMNLDYWRDNDLANKMIECGLMHPEMRYHDQDVINHICQDVKIVLPLKYGVVDTLFAIDDTYQRAGKQQIEECLSQPVIIHYAGKAPWLKDVAIHPWSDLWQDINRQQSTPVKLRYKSKGLLKFKVILWDLLHPNHKRIVITKEEIRKRLTESQKL